MSKRQAKQDSPVVIPHPRQSHAVRRAVTPDRAVLIPPPEDKPDAAYIVRFPLEVGIPFYTFWMSDLHLDAPECWRDLLRANLDEAVSKNAMIFDVGDILDVIASRNDPRGNKGNVRPEDNTGHYLDSVISNACEFLHPYRNHLAVIGTGNHEAAVYKKLETDLTARLIEKINSRRNSALTPIQRGNYRYWVAMQAHCVSRGSQQTRLICAYHGSGGGGEVTKGSMQAQRKMAVFNADIVVLGHIHERWEMDIRQEVLNPSTKEPQLRRQLTVQLGSYKTDWRLDGKATWHMMKAGSTPKPLGGKFLTFGIRGTHTSLAMRTVDPEVLDVEMGA